MHLINVISPEDSTPPMARIQEVIFKNSKLQLVTQDFRSLNVKWDIDYIQNDSIYPYQIIYLDIL